MVKELGVAYHGNVYLDNARSDFKEMEEYGCNAVLLAMSEYDYEQWRGHYYKMAQIANEEFGFTVYINFWAWGRIFGGEAPSVFLSDNAQFRQTFSKTRKSFPAACFNTKKFQSYIKSAIKKVSRVKAIDGFFWDQPHFAYSAENLLPTKLSPFYVCNCETCKNLFFQKYQYQMPQKENEDIIAFKELSLVGFLQDLCKTVKKSDQGKKNVICVMHSDAATGISNWDKVCFDEMDMLATDPYWMLYQKDLDWVKEESEKLVKIARTHRKRAQLWVLAFAIPDKREAEIKKAVNIMNESGADSIFAWLYRGGLQTLIKSKNPVLVWKMVGEGFKSIQK